MTLLSRKQTFRTEHVPSNTYQALFVNSTHFTVTLIVSALVSSASLLLRLWLRFYQRVPDSFESAPNTYRDSLVGALCLIIVT
jgi:hypothetical protein